MDIKLTVRSSLSGYFAYVDTYAHVIDGQKGYLFSPTYSLTTIPHCLILWYYHDGVGAITVHTRQNAQYSSAIWAAPDVGAKQWRQGSVTVSGNNDFQVSLKFRPYFVFMILNCYHICIGS